MKKLSLVAILWCLVAGWAVGEGAADLVKLHLDEVKDGTWELWGENPNFLAYQVKVEFPVAENIQFSAPLPFHGVLPAKTTHLALLRVSIVDREKGWSYKNRYTIFPGDPTKAPDPKMVYWFPFQHGTKHKVGQGYNGTFSHQGENALDFNMDIGTPVTAARGGVVFEVKQDSNVGGPDHYYDDKANYVKVDHGDGTMAEYVHLRQNGATVKPGDVVKAGQIIGYSGNTGYSSGPHLHFEVDAFQRDAVAKSIPTVFLGPDGLAISAEEGDYYYGIFAGGKSFPVRFGADLKDEDYKDWSAQATGSKIEIRKETVDDTTAFFVSNPTSDDISVTFTAEGQNLEISKTQPVTVRAKAGKEAYLCLIRPAKPGAFSFSTRIRYRAVP